MGSWGALRQPRGKKLWLLFTTSMRRRCLWRRWWPTDKRARELLGEAPSTPTPFSLQVLLKFLKRQEISRLSGIDQLPENVDPGKREEFLTDAEFLEVRSFSSVNKRLLDDWGKSCGRSCKVKKRLTVVSWDKTIMFQSLSQAIAHYPGARDGQGGLVSAACLETDRSKASKKSFLAPR